MNRMMNAFLAMAAAVVIMVFNPNPVYAQTRPGNAPSVVCPNPSLVETAKDMCKNPSVAAACPTECAQVACINNCLQPPAPQPTATTPTPPAPTAKKLTPLPTQLICEGSKTIVNSTTGKPDCGCDPEKITDEQGVAHDVPRVAVMKSPLQYKSTDSTIQAVKTLVCVSTGDATKFVEGVLQQHTKKIRDLEEFAKQQKAYDLIVAGHIAALWAEVNKVKGWMANIQANINNINASLAQFDAAYGKIRREIDAMKEGLMPFGLAAEFSAFNMGDAGTALAPGLRLSFRSLFPSYNVGYYANANIGLVYRDGIDPSSGGQGSAYHGGFGVGLFVAPTDNKALSIYGGFRMEQFFRTKDPNFLGSMFGGVLGLDYQIPDSHLFIGGEGFLAGTYRVVYFSNDRQVHTNSKDVLFGGSLYVGLRTNLF
ncbi:MAG: hypothetical protein PHC70_04575 [Patescibacteria group bacterium]|nr:hypothetical protein [Patescibacteria group bacterium]